MRLNCVAVVISAALLVLPGCAGTRKASVGQRSGFLGLDYGLLKEGSDTQSQLVYVNPNANFKRYNKVLIAPVAVIRSESSNLAGYSKDEIQSIANTTYSAFATALSKDFSVVRAPEPGTIKVEIAITDVDRSEPTLDTITSIIPQTRMLSMLKTVVTGKPLFVGEASGEGKITDATTGELLSAGMDRRVGTKNLSGVTSSWNDFDEAVDYWAKRFAYNLCLKRDGGEKCVKPSA